MIPLHEGRLRKWPEILTHLHQAELNETELPALQNRGLVGDATEVAPVRYFGLGRPQLPVGFDKEPAD